MKTCFVCRKPVAGEGLLKWFHNGVEQKDAEIRWHDACEAAYIAKRREIWDDYKPAKDDWERRQSSMQKRLIKKAGGYLRKDGKRFWPWKNPPAGVVTPQPRPPEVRAAEKAKRIMRTLLALAKERGELN